MDKTLHFRSAACHRPLLAGMAWLLLLTSVMGKDLPKFRPHVLANDLKAGYQLIVTDLTGDGKKDLIAIDEFASEVPWFENRHPAWKRRVLARDVPRPLNADCLDIDGDRLPEVVLTYHFDPSPQRGIGNLIVLKRGSDLDQPWTAHEFDRLPTAHRIRWIDPQGSGDPLLAVAPIVGKQSPPAADDPAPIYRGSLRKPQRG